ncbi:MAG: TatD family hydrolase [Desulfuromonadales bacterium]|nr:TatD family hydrolase [Desulfuromonadales bacterium]MBN2790895.1 TatD family hydrolase [Desulfuromonadales bacterium]
MDWIDTHIHLSAPEWSRSPQELYSQAQSAGISSMLMPGVRASDWQDLLALAGQLAGVYFAPGLHPAYADQWNEGIAEQLKELSTNERVVAIGEIGLDRVAGPAPVVQERVFREQLAIALNAGLPVLLHSRKTTGRVIAILRELAVGQTVGGIWHGFSGSVQVAHELVELGFKIGVGPILLRESARKLPQVVKALPATALVLESDAPDMIDCPSGLLRVAQKLAELKGWSLEETARITGENACPLFAMKLSC